MENVLECEILSAWAPLTDDHFPISLTVRLPEPVKNMPFSRIELPGIPIWKFKIDEFKKDTEKKVQYQEEILKRLQNNEQVSYQDLVDILSDSANSSVGMSIRAANQQPKEQEPSLIERSRTHCQNVLASRNYLLYNILYPKNGEPPSFQRTSNIDKLCRLLPKEYSLPPHRTDMSCEEADKWFVAVCKLYRELTDRQQLQDAEDKYTRIAAMIERSDANEISKQKAWYRAANIVKNSLKSAQKQTLVINEIDPTEKDIPEYEPSDPDSVRNGIRKFWAHIFKRRVSEKEPNPPWLDENNRPSIPQYNLDLCKEISESEFGAALKKLKDGKASGHDHIPAELLKLMPKEAMEILRTQFNSVLATGNIPESWKISQFYTLHKSGDAACCSNYRPIALLSVPYKLFMTIMTIRLTEFAEKNSLLSNTQGGFRSKRGCLHKAQLLKMVFKKLKTSNKNIHAIFIDLVKAYDSVPVDALLEALKFLRVPEDMRTLLARIYEGRKGSVITVYGDTDLFDISRGLAQGDPISPLLFNLFLEPLLRWLSKEKHSLDYLGAYADDIVQASESNERILAMMSCFSRWAKHNAIEIGISDKGTKTAFMTDNPVAIAPKIPTVSAKIHESFVELTYSEPNRRLPILTGENSYKYLGIWMNASLNWKPHIKSVKAKLNMFLVGLRRKHYNRRQIIVIINSIVVPMVLYGAEVVEIKKKTLKKWDTKIQALVNHKGGLHAFARAATNYLPTSIGGSGLISLADEAENLKIIGALNTKLNSIDDEARELASQEWEANSDSIVNPVINESSVSNLVTLVENVAYKKDLDEDSLLRLFVPNDPRINILAHKGVTNFSELVDPKGKIKSNLLTENQYRSICVGKSRHVKPHFLARFNHPAALTGVPHKSTQGRARFYTDASQSKDSIGIGIYCPSRTKLSTSEKLDPQLVTNNTEAEIVALAIAVSAFDKNVTKTEIFCDSTSAIATIVDEKIKVANPVIHELVSTARKIHSANQNKISIAHVYSHTLDGKNPEEEADRAAFNEARFGDQTGKIVRGNDKADRLAKFSSYQEPTIGLQWMNKTLPRFLLCKKKGMKPISNIRKTLNNHRAVTRIKELLKEEEKYGWLNCPDIHFPLSERLLKVKNRIYAKAINFAERCRRGLTDSKKTRLERQKLQYWLKRYRYRLVSNDKCDGCGKVEDRFHFLHCNSSRHLRSQITDDIIELLSEHTVSFDPSILPRFWSEERLECITEETALTQDFPIEHAARGLVSIRFTKYLLGLKWRPSCEPEHGIVAIHLLILEGLRQCWVLRCKLLYSNTTYATASDPTSSASTETPRTANVATTTQISRLERLQRRHEQRCQRSDPSSQNPD